MKKYLLAVLLASASTIAVANVSLDLTVHYAEQFATQQDAANFLKGHFSQCVQSDNENTYTCRTTANTAIQLLPGRLVTATVV